MTKLRPKPGRSAKPPRRRRVHALWIWPTFAVLLAAPSRAQPTEPASAEAEPKRWSAFLPLMAEEARRRGYDLPLPFGITLIYNYLERDILVNDLSIGIDGAPVSSVSSYVDLGSTSHVHVGLARADVWLLPFLNLYMLLGGIDNVSTTRAFVTLPGPGSQTLEFTGETQLNGFVGGGGLTVAAGYEQFFLMADANYTQTDLGFDDSFRALVMSTRAGWHGRVGGLASRFWAGIMYWDTRNIARATIDVPNVGRVRFEADQGPLNPWNPSIGASAAFSKQWEAFAEYGFNFDDVQVLAAGVTYRF